MTKQPPDQLHEIAKLYADLIPKSSIDALSDLQNIINQSGAIDVMKYVQIPQEEVKFLFSAAPIDTCAITNAFDETLINSISQISKALSNSFLNDSFTNMSLILANLYQNQFSYQDTYSVEQLKQITNETTKLEKQLTTTNTIETISTKDKINAIYCLLVLIEIIISLFSSQTNLFELKDTKIYFDIFSNNTVNIINILETNLDPSMSDNPEQDK